MLWGNLHVVLPVNIDPVLSIQGMLQCLELVLAKYEPNQVQVGCYEVLWLDHHWQNLFYFFWTLRIRRVGHQLSPSFYLEMVSNFFLQYHPH